MKTRRLSHGMVEAYNSKFRIRYKPQPQAEHDLLIIYHLKQNRFYYKCTELKVENGLTMEQLLDICSSVGAES
ncbi:MAG: hypothetical protein AAFY48_08185 [Bacteroidota bacterium]